MSFSASATSALASLSPLRAAFWFRSARFFTEAKAREAGKLRLEGKEYVVQDGDVIEFRFNV